MNQQESSLLSGAVSFDYGTGPPLFPSLRHFYLHSSPSSTTSAAGVPLPISVLPIANPSIFSQHFQHSTSSPHILSLLPKPYSRTLHFSITVLGALPSATTTPLLVTLTDPLDPTRTHPVKTFLFCQSDSISHTSSDFVLIPPCQTTLALSFSFVNSLYFDNLDIVGLIFSS